MSDVLECAKESSDPISFLLQFNGIAFVGGFSYGDVGSEEWRRLAATPTAYRVGVV